MSVISDIVEGVEGAISPAAPTTQASAKPPQADPLGHLPAALKAVAPHLTEQQSADWLGVLAPAFRTYGIINNRRIAAALGQFAVESGGFRILSENLNYTEARLCQVWPSRFPTEEDAAPYAMSPVKLGNHIYAHRLGNGDEASGDGYAFRGRGIIQITGRANYERYAKVLAMKLADFVTFASTLRGAAVSACLFWVDDHTHPVLNDLADKWLIDKITLRVNGGMNGAADRLRLSNAALHAIS
jgi:putative chitinase